MLKLDGSPIATERLMSDDGANVAVAGGQEPVDVGSVDSAPIEDNVQDAFDFSVDIDGETRSWKSKDELADYIRNGTLMHSDYTKKTQSLADQRRAYEADMKRQQAEYEQLLDMKSKYDKIDGWIKDDPRRLEIIKQQMSNLGPNTFNRETNEQLSALQKELEAIKKEREESARQAEIQRRNEMAYKNLSKRYPDFKQDIVDSFASEINQLHPNLQAEKMAELIYLANKARGMDPAKVEQKISDDLELKQALRKSVKTGPKPPAGKPVPKTIDEAKRLAKKELGLE